MRKSLIITALILSQLLTTTIPIEIIAQENKLTWEVYFSPKEGAIEAILRELRSAKKTILFHAYQITSQKISREIEEAHTRGVKVQIILDKKESSAKDSRATSLHKHGIQILTDKQHQKSHNKVIIIDVEIVITGSYNFTNAAEKNAENLIVIHDEKIAAIYIKNWNEHAEHSKVFSPKEN